MNRCGCDCNDELPWWAILLLVPLGLVLMAWWRWTEHWERGRRRVQHEEAL